MAAIFTDYPIGSDDTPQQTGERIQALAAGADSVEVILEAGQAGAERSGVLRAWYGLRQDGSNAPGADPDGHY